MTVGRLYPTLPPLTKGRNHRPPTFILSLKGRGEI